MPWYEKIVTIKLSVEADDKEDANSKYLNEWVFNQPWGFDVEVDVEAQDRLRESGWTKAPDA